MKRLNHLLLALLIGLPMFLLVSACGPDDDKSRPRIPQSRLRPRQTTKNMSPEEKTALFTQRAEATAGALTWPEGKGPARDAKADSIECQQKAAADPRVANANPLTKLVFVSRCLAEKGWKLDRAALETEG